MVPAEGASNLNLELQRFLRAAGYTQEDILQMTLDTRLVQDLRLDGDNLVDTIKILEEEFQVDLSGFNLTKYSPSEGELLFPHAEIRWLRKLLGGGTRESETITLRLLAKAILLKQWPNEDGPN